MERQENVNHSQEENQSIQADPEITEIMEFAHKD